TRPLTARPIDAAPWPTGPRWHRQGLQLQGWRGCRPIAMAAGRSRDSGPRSRWSACARVVPQVDRAVLPSRVAVAWTIAAGMGLAGGGDVRQRRAAARFLAGRLCLHSRRSVEAGAPWEEPSVV